MSKSYAELLSLADKNSRTAAQKLEEERRKRERFKDRPAKSRPVDEAAIKQILERRRREQEQQKLAEQQRLKRQNELKKQPPPPPPPPKTSRPPKKDPPKSTPPPSSKKAAPAIPYEDLMRYASLKTNNQPIPKELAHVAESLRANKPSPSTSQVKTQPPSSKQQAPAARPSSSSSSTTNRISNTSNQQKSLPVNRVTITQKTSLSNSQRSSLPNGQKSSNSNGQRSSLLNGQKSSISNGQRSSLLNGQKSSTSNGQRPVNTNQRPPPNRPMNGQRPSNGFARKRPVVDTDDEDDDADLEGFVVDDDEDDGFDYRKELHETLRTNFGFNKDRYQRRMLDEDDDDLRNMESSYAQIEKEEDYSARVGLQEDIDDILREEAEKKRLSQVKKRLKTAA